MPSSRKFVPYIPQAPKPRPEKKAQSTSEAKAARPSCSETSSSQVNGPWFHIDDFLMADANASHKSAPSQMVSEHNQPGWDLLGEGGSDQVTEPMDGSSRELSLLVEGDTAQVEPRGMATEYQENERCTAASDETNSTEQHGYLNINGVHTLSEDNCQASPLAQDKPLLDVSSVMEGLSTTRKRMCPSSVDTVVDPPALLPNVTSELRLEDHRLAKRRRPIERQVEDTMLDHLPTPEVTPRPTSSGLDSYPTVSDEPCPGFLGTGSQSGTGSPAPSPNIVEEENGAHIHRTVEELPQSTEPSISSLQRPEGEPYRKCWNGEARESCEKERLDKVPSRCSTRTSQQRKHNNRQSSNMGRGLSRTSHRQRGESTITTRTSRYTASLQSDPSSEPMVDSVIYSCSPPISSTKTKNIGIVNRDQRLIASTDCRITDIAHYDVPKGSSIVTTIVHCNEPSLALDVAALYHKLFGNHGKALRTTKLSADSWMLLGYRYNAACTHGSWTRLNTDPMSNSHDDFDQSDNYDDDHEEEEEEDEAYQCHAASFDQGFNRENMRCDQYTNKPWSEFDKKRLLLYKAEMAMEWKQIFARFPDRSPGAVRTRWHMLQGRGCATAAT